MCLRKYFCEDTHTQQFSCAPVKRVGLTHLQVNDGAKLAEVLVEFADVVQLGWDGAHIQFGVGQTEGVLLVEALVIRLIVVGPVGWMGERII